MSRTNFSPEELIGRWEDKRDIKNLMGRYMLARQLQQEATMYDTFWCKQAEEPALATADGWYVGEAAIRGYYESLIAIDRYKASVLYQEFPDKFQGKTEEDVLGIGDYDMDPVSVPLIEVASDGMTAKGIWYCAGSGIRVGTSGPVSWWDIGFYTCDFVREEGQWRLWHMAYHAELSFPSGQNWAEAPRDYPALEHFEAMKDTPPVAAPTIPGPVWKRYHVRRRFVGTPRLPEPYDTFAETFSYGPECEGKERNA